MKKRTLPAGKIDAICSLILKIRNDNYPISMDNSILESRYDLTTVQIAEIKNRYKKYTNGGQCKCQVCKKEQFGATADKRLRTSLIFRGKDTCFECLNSNYFNRETGEIEPYEQDDFAIWETLANPARMCLHSEINGHSDVTPSGVNITGEGMPWKRSMRGK